MLGKIAILPAAGEFFWIFLLLNLIFFEIFNPLDFFVIHDMQTPLDRKIFETPLEEKKPKKSIPP